MNKSRTYKSFKNSIVAVIAQFLSVLLSFITRTVFIKYLSIEYLGMNGLFTNILTMLSLAELGVGTAIVYSMYKPLAEKDEFKISALMNLYEKLYRYIGIFIGVIGLLLVPFLDILIKDKPNVGNLQLIYLLYLTNSVISYFFTYKRSIIIADQHGYINKYNIIIFSFIQNIIQIVLLIIYRSFYLYLLTQIICTFLSNIFISIKAKKMYPFLNKYKKAIVDKETKNAILKNVIAMMSHKLGSAVVSGTDSLLISSFVGITYVGLYSNYKLITNTLKGLVLQVTDSITATVGNLTVTESNEYSYEIFNKIYFINFIITFFSASFLFTLIDPFITVWIGEQYLLGKGIVFMIVIDFFIIQMRQPSIVFINSYGLFWQIKWKSIIEASVNLVVSLIWVGYFKLGILGILIGTFISNILTNTWCEPYVVFVNGFKMSSKKYFANFFYDSTISILNIFLVNYICTLVSFNGITKIIFNFVITGIISTIIFSIFFYRRKEFKYCMNLILAIIKNKIAKG